MNVSTGRVRGMGLGEQRLGGGPVSGTVQAVRVKEVPYPAVASCHWPLTGSRKITQTATP